MNLKAIDRPDLISRVFKLKYEQMLLDLTKKHLLGKVVACEFAINVVLKLIHLFITFYFSLQGTSITWKEDYKVLIRHDGLVRMFIFFVIRKL